MTRDRGMSAERYARRIATTWERLSGRAVVLSEREWRLLCDWHDRGVPVPLVEQAMQEAAGRRGGAPRSLAWLGPAVEESWQAIVGGRRPAEPQDAASPPAEAWRSRLDAEGESPLGALLRDALQALDDGMSRAELDDRVDEALPGAVDADLVRRAEAEIDLRLAVFGGKLEPEAFDRSRRRAVVAALRRRLGLPRLAGGGW